MPTPTVAPPPKERVLPSNFDELVRRAMQGGAGVHALKKALEESPIGQDAPLPATPPPASPSPLPEAAVGAPDEPGTPRPAPAPVDPFEALVAAASDALARRDDERALAEALDAVDSAVAAIRARPPREPAGPEAPTSDEGGPGIRLPAARHPHALVVGTVPAGMETARLAGALEVDLATARAAVLAGGTRMVLRGADAAPLEQRAASLRALGLRAGVVAREDLLVFGEAGGFVGFERAGSWRVARAPRWGEVRPDPSQLPRGEVTTPVTIWLVVPGEVEERRLRPPAAESRWQRGHYAAPNGAGTETRVAVVDLYTDVGLVRLVEGAVDVRGLGEPPPSQRQAVRLLVESVSARWPDAHVEARRTLPATARGGERADGWPAWEEHSRACAALYARGER
jgi:hypothetical protein